MIAVVVVRLVGQLGTVLIKVSLLSAHVELIFAA